MLICVSFVLTHLVGLEYVNDSVLDDLRGFKPCVVQILEHIFIIVERLRVFRAEHSLLLQLKQNVVISVEEDGLCLLELGLQI